MAGILTMTSDRLKYDRLKDNRVSSVDTYDPLGKNESNRIKTYDNELGYAVHPEEQGVDYARRDYIAGEANKQQAAIDAYKKQYGSDMAAANKQADGILNKARGQVAGVKRPAYDLVPVRVYTENVLEGEYRVPRSAAEQMARESFNGSEGHYASRWADGNSALNVDTRPVGAKSGYGAELHESLRLAQEETNGAIESSNLAYDGAIAEANGQIAGAEKTIRGQQSLAEATYNSNVGMAEETKAHIQAQWTNYQNTMKQAYTQGMADNTSGIYALINSGALQLKGNVK